MASAATRPTAIKSKNIKNKPDVVLVLDLDYTVFNSSVKSSVEFYGGEEVWVSFLDKTKARLDKLGLTFSLAILTSKDDPDDLCDAAVRAFEKHLICLDVTTNSVIKFPNTSSGYLIFNRAGETKVCSPYGGFYIDSSSSRFSFMHVACEAYYTEEPMAVFKEAHLKLMQTKLGLAASQMIMADDRKIIADVATKNGYGAVQAVNMDSDLEGFFDKLNGAIDKSAVSASALKPKVVELKKEVALVFAGAGAGAGDGVAATTTVSAELKPAETLTYSWWGALVRALMAGGSRYVA